MTPAARVQAAIEVLDRILDGVAAEQALTGWARRSRFAGSKDRAAVRDHVFDALRCLRSCAALGGGMNGRAVMLGLLRREGADPDAIFGVGGHAPDPLTEAELAAGRVPQDGAEALDVPDWLWRSFRDSLGERTEETARALQSRAPVHLRVNAGRTTRDKAIANLAAEGIQTREHPAAAMALEVIEGARKLRGCSAFADGLIELQDAASQAVVEGLPLRDGMLVLDYCAGGGGKALAMAARADIDLFVHDVDPKRMRDIPARADRAGIQVKAVETSDLDRLGQFDLILCDVPCSGSGSWRRAPHGKWTLTPDGLDRLRSTQAEILDTVAPRVDTGGVLAYATCSVLACENTEQVERFCARTRPWQPGFTRSWRVPEGTDGFFAAHLTRADT